MSHGHSGQEVGQRLANKRKASRARRHEWDVGGCTRVCVCSILVTDRLLCPGTGITRMEDLVARGGEEDDDERKREREREMNEWKENQGDILVETHASGGEGEG